MNALATVGIKHLKDILLYDQIGVSSMDSNEEVMSRLKFIGHIQKDEKINVRYVNRQPNNWATTVSRSLLYPDNRTNALKFFRDVISRTFDIIEKNIRNKDLFICRGIVMDLLKSRQGLLNMKHTYMDDTKFCCDMDVMIERVVSKLSDLRKEHAELFKDEEEVDNLP
jgi:hypothetical protein